MAKIFLSYAHSGPDHVERAVALASSLAEHGHNVRLDRHASIPRQGWLLWMTLSILEADLVVCVCDDAWVRRVDLKEEDPARGFGVAWEGHVLLNHVNAWGSSFPVVIGATFDGSAANAPSHICRLFTGTLHLPRDFERFVAECPEFERLSRAARRAAGSTPSPEWSDASTPFPVQRLAHEDHWLQRTPSALFALTKAAIDAAAAGDWDTSSRLAYIVVQSTELSDPETRRANVETMRRAWYLCALGEVAQLALEGRAERRRISIEMANAGALVMDWAAQQWKSPALRSQFFGHALSLFLAVDHVTLVAAYAGGHARVGDVYDAWRANALGASGAPLVERSEYTAAMRRLRADAMGRP